MGFQGFGPLWNRRRRIDVLHIIKREGLQPRMRFFFILFFPLRPHRWFFQFFLPERELTTNSNFQRFDYDDPLERKTRYNGGHNIHPTELCTSDGKWKKKNYKFLWKENYYNQRGFDNNNKTKSFSLRSPFFFQENDAHTHKKKK